jgi:uncharacterized protein (DUF736 family)
MAYEHREGGGALFKNDKKESDKHPDYKGTIMLGGKVYQIAGWKKEGTKGTFLSLKGEEQREKPNKTARGLESDHPF